MYPNKFRQLNILAIDTSESSINVGLLWHGHFIYKTQESHNHQASLQTVLHDTFRLCDGFNVANIDVLVCTKGPGTYIGTRVGIAMTKGLAVTTNIPCIFMSTLEPYIVHALPAIVIVKKSKKSFIIQIHYTTNIRSDLLQCSLDQLCTITTNLTQCTPHRSISFYYRNSEVRHAIETQCTISRSSLYSFHMYPQRRYIVNLMRYGAKRYASNVISSHFEDAMYLNDG